MASKLCTAEVVHIRKLAGAGTPVRDIAQAYGIGQETVRRLLRGETWARVEASPSAPSEPIQRAADESLAQLMQQLNEEGEQSGSK